MDALLIIAIGIIITALWWKVGYWKYFWIGLLVLLGAVEGAAIIGTGKTISQQFWIYFENNTARGWVLLSSIAAFMIVLIIHLAWKKIRR